MSWSWGRTAISIPNEGLYLCTRSSLTAFHITGNAEGWSRWGFLQMAGGSLLITGPPPPGGFRPPRHLLGRLHSTVQAIRETYRPLSRISWHKRPPNRAWPAWLLSMMEWLAIGMGEERWMQCCLTLVRFSCYLPRPSHVNALELAWTVGSKHPKVFLNGFMFS